MNLGMEWNLATWIFGGGFAVHQGFEVALDLIQLRHLGQRRGRVPRHLQGKVDLATVQRAVDYNRARLRLGLVGRLLNAALVWGLLFFGFAALQGFVAGLGWGALVGELAFLGLLALIGAAWSLPLDLVSTFGVEERFGFNRQTGRGFALDRLKELVIAGALGGLLAGLVLGLMRVYPELWWIPAYLGVAVIQLLVAWIYPVAIMPLFNRFTPVAEELAEDVARLARRVEFPLAGVVTMDSSRRSTHTNAFIVGLWGARRIVLFDELVSRVSRGELLAVLAHELGHFKLGHIQQRLVLALGGMLVAFAVMAWLREQTAVYPGLGFVRPSDSAALVIFFLMASELLFPVGWILRAMYRRSELAADRFAVETVQGGVDLGQALVQLTKQNLSSPGSHPLYRSYHNSHPPLRTRLREIATLARAQGLSALSDLGQIDGPVTPKRRDGVDHRDEKSGDDEDFSGKGHD